MLLVVRVCFGCDYPLRHLHARYLIHLLLLRARSRRWLLLLFVRLGEDLTSLLCKIVSGKGATKGVFNGLGCGWACWVISGQGPWRSRSTSCEVAHSN